MTTLRRVMVIAIATAALFASRASAEDGGWNTKYGMLFQVQNVFTRQGILSGYGDGSGAGIGVQYNLAPTRAVRLMVNLNRASDPVATTQTTTNGVAGPDVIVLPGLAPGSNVGAYEPTSTLTTDVGGAYLIRATTSSLSPYFGAGAGLTFRTEKSDFNGTTNGTNSYDVNDSKSTFAFGAVGILGVEWRVHKSVSMFAEYGLNLSLYDSISEKANHTINGTSTERKSSHSTYFTFDTGLNQGAQLGLVAFF